MNRKTVYTILIASLSALLGSATMNAQGTTEIANVPFAFHANGKTLPAGKYLVEQKSTSTVFYLSNKTGPSAFVSFGTMRSGDPADPKLTFLCYGHECALSAISMPGDMVAYGASDASLDRQFSHKIGMAALISVRLTPR